MITNIDVNCQNEYGQNLLQEAIVSNMDEIAIDLVKKKINVNHQDGKGLSPLHYCAQYCNILYAKLLQKSEMRKDIVIELSYKGFG